MLLNTRGAVLRSVGHRVTTTTMPIEDDGSLLSVDLLLVCHTLDEAQRHHDLAALRLSNSRAKSLCLVPHAGKMDPHSAVLESFTGPYEMLRKISLLLAS